MAPRKKEEMYELETAVETHNVKTDYGEWLLMFGIDLRTFALATIWGRVVISSWVCRLHPGTAETQNPS